MNDVISQCLTIGRQRGEECICAHVCSEEEEASFLLCAQILKTPVFEQTLKEKLILLSFLPPSNLVNINSEKHGNKSKNS